jgi:hypothetical protein
MAQGRPRDLRKEQQWRQWLQQWQHSGLTVRAFCARHRLPEHRFYAWRKRLRQRPAAPAPFLPVHVLDEPQAQAAHALEVVLAGGRRLGVAPGFDPRTLRQLLVVLEEAGPC